MKEYDFPSIGCYFDGAAGQEFNDARVIKLAISYGFDDQGEMEKIEEIRDAYTEESDEYQEATEYLNETVQTAEDYLNGLENRPYLSWRWHDGDFGLYPNVDGAQEDCEFVSSTKEEYPSLDYEGEWLHVNDHGNCTLYVREHSSVDGGTLVKDKEIWSVV